jgi:ankyrin repeat protein
LTDSWAWESISTQQALFFPNALATAAAGGHPEVVELFLEHGTDVNQLGGLYGSALTSAANNVMMKFLLRIEADMLSASEDGRSSLHFASGNGHARVVQVLFNHGADVNSHSQTGWTPLMYGSDKGRKSAVEILLDRGAHVGYVSNAQEEREENI